MTDSRITWHGPVQLARSEYYLGYLGRLEVARLDSNLSRDTWKLKLKVPGYVTDAPGGVRYGSPAVGYQAAEEILGRWMKDVGMAWAPRRNQQRTWVEWGIRYVLLTEIVDSMISQSEAERVLTSNPGMFAGGVVVSREARHSWTDWKPVTP